MSSSKGKGILLEEDDDEPILLPDQADEYLIKEYSLSLIGKILNHKKQNVWSGSLSQCREPIVDENYPSMVPFWIQLQGIPLHLCTHQNLEAIGDRLGKVDKIDATEGKIRVEIDSNKPLKFTRKLQTRKKEDINIKLQYEMLFKHCITCGLMTHEAQDCPMKQSNVMSHPTGRERVFDRVTSRGDLRDDGSRVPAGNSHGKDETARSHKDGTSSHSRVQRSTHSSRTSRVPKQRDSRYNPYSYGRNQASTGKHQDTGKEQLWKEKHLRPLKIVDQQPRDATSASVGETIKLRSIVTDEASRRHSDQTSPADVVPKARTTMEQPPMDTNVTFRPNSTQRSHMEVADDLIPPYNALKIDALNEHDIENEEEILDADMEDPIMGTELALMEEDDLLGDDLVNVKSPEMTGSG
ncbi:hypothetical protein YC2023_118431 [Brassica napus]